MKKTRFEGIVQDARLMGAKYIGVKGLSSDCKYPVIRIHQTEDYILQYREEMEQYDTDMVWKYSREDCRTQITDVAYGNTFSDIEVKLHCFVSGWKALIAKAIDRAYDRMIERTPHMTEEERINCEIIRESVKANFINGNRTEIEARFIKEHIGDYEDLFEICMNGNELDFKRGIAKLLRMQNEYASRISKE